MESEKITFSPKLKPLFRLKTRYAILIGGRGGGKSFALATAMGVSTYDDGFNILYTRYTMTSAEITVIPEFMGKLQLLGADGDFHTRRHDVVNLGTGSRIFFRGIKTSSKNQTANLKSLYKVKEWVLDEAQEMVNETEFDTIDDSLREKDADIHVILVLNQPDVQHWIYKRFYAQAGVAEDFAGVKGDVTYIPITYLDNLKNLHPTFIEKAEAMKRNNPEKYEHIYGLAWGRNTQGRIYKNWEEIRPEDYPTTLHQWYGMDWGYADWPNATVRMCYDPARGILYLYEVPQLDDPAEARLTRGAAKAVMADAKSIGMAPYECEVYCDPARPENIAELRTIYDLSGMKAINKDKVGRIHYLQGFTVKYVGENIRKEVETYSWQKDPNNESLFIDKPQDGNDHYMDCISYGATRLRGMGVNGDE